MRLLLCIILTGSIHIACQQDVAIAQIPFTKHTVNNTLVSCASLWAEDMDDDGDLDLITGYNFAGISWWRNDGGEPIQWTRQPIVTQGGGFFSVVAADLNQDAQTDVISAAWNDAEVCWWNWDEVLGWEQIIIDDSAAGAHEVHAVDLDDDGDIDLLAALAEDDEIVWYRNEGGIEPEWIRSVVGTDFGGARSMVSADFDLDGDLDVVGAALDDNAVIWWRQDWSDSTVWTEFPIATNFNMSHHVAVADMDNDGDMDIIGAGYGGDVVIWVNGQGDPLQWSEILVDDQVPGALQAKPVDLDDDGWLDLIGTSDFDDTVIAWYSGGETLTDWTRQIIGDNFNGPWPIISADLDDDGDQDIVSSAYHGSEVAWWEHADEWVCATASGEPRTGHAPLTVQFHQVVSAHPPANYWGWDFDNDGVTDLEETDPVWVYSEPGTYSVALYVSNGDLWDVFVLEDYVQVWDGESALAFITPADHVVCDAITDLNLTGALSVEAWINPAGWGNVPNLGYGRILDKQSFKLYLVGTHPAWTSNCLLLELIHDDGSLSRSFTPEGSISLNSLQHVAATYDGSGVVVIYIDGVSQILEQSASPNGPLQDNLDYELYIGNSAALNLAFQGMIDEVRLWSTVRSGDDIEDWLHSDLHGYEPGLLADWQLDEGNGDLIHDNASHIPPGNINGAVWVEGVDQNLNAIQPPDPTIDPAGFTLLGIYPNPANPATAIEFQLPAPAVVSLDVYNMSGRKVATLLADRSLTAGEHSVGWDCQQMASGLYFVRLRAADQNSFGKVIILK